MVAGALGKSDVRRPKHIFQGGQILHTWIVSGIKQTNTFDSLN